MRVPNPLKPWFVYCPSQLLRRVVRGIRTPRDPIQVVELPWGCPLEIDTRETIGQAIWTCGVYDLAVVEVLTRLAHPRLLALDVGANIGAMTGALAARAGEVWAFEPHPAVCLRLSGNVSRFMNLTEFAPCHIFQHALSDREGEARLEAPEGFGNNHGLARLTTGNGIAVQTARLAELLGDREVGVMKLDVEGHELNVLQGAEPALAAGRIRHIVFEDHVGAGSPVCGYLKAMGYQLFEIGWRLAGPTATCPNGRGARTYEAPSYLATRDPIAVLASCMRRGWECLRRKPAGRSFP